MIRRLVLLLAAMAVTATVAGAGAALAQPQDPPAPGSGPAAVSSTALPEGFPADLRKYVGGTEEFKSAEWFTGPCQARGGDMGTYLSAMLTNENRLMWWSMSEDNKVALLMGSGAFRMQNAVGTEAAARQFVQSGQEPSDAFLPKVFPAGDATYHPPKGVCADDLKGWATGSSTTWGFEWVAPDTTSLRAAQAAEGGDKVPDQAWTEPCSSEELGVYCAHAFFVNCNKAANDGGSVDALQRCRDWNAAVGRLFAGTANWIDQNTSLGDRIGSVLGGAVSSSPGWQLGKWVVSALSGLGSAVVKAAKFIEDPSSIADDWANSIKPAAIEFATKVLQSLSGTGHFDPSADWFRRQYEVAVAIGFILMAFMTVLAARRAATRGATGELTESLFQYLPLSVFLAIFGPGFAALVLELTGSLSDSLAEWGGTPAGELISHISEFNGATSQTFPGGSLVAIIMFGLLMLGALSLWVGLMFHDYGLPLAGAVSGISVFLMIHPKYRHKALRPIFLFLGIAFSVPALFFLLSVLFTAANAVYAEGSDSGLGLVAKVFQVGLAMIMVGLAPWALLKWSPILPTAADSEDFGSGGSSIIGDSVNSAGNALMFARGGDHSLGGGQPAARSDGGSTGGAPGTDQGGNGAGGGKPAQGDGAATTGDANNPLTRAYHEKGGGESPQPLGSAGQHPGLQAGESGTAAGGRAAAAGGTAASGAATGGATIVAAVGVQTVSSAINKAKAEADDTAPRTDDDR